MDRLSIVMVRSSLLWLLAGVAIGSLMLFVGWLVQFALGIAYWLMPRKGTPERPLGYREGLAISGAVALNVGLASRVIVEPLERTGHGDPVTPALLARSATSQSFAIVLLVAQLWPRMYGHTKLGRNLAPGG